MWHLGFLAKYILNLISDNWSMNQWQTRPGPGSFLYHPEKMLAPSPALAAWFVPLFRSISISKMQWAHLTSYRTCWEWESWGPENLSDYSWSVTTRFWGYTQFFGLTVIHSLKILEEQDSYITSRKKLSSLKTIFIVWKTSYWLKMVPWFIFL